METGKANVIVVDFTSFNVRGEQVFFNKTMDEVRFELMEKCNTTVIHKTNEYDMAIMSQKETIENKTIVVETQFEQNVFSLIKVRRNLLGLSKSVINEATSLKLKKASDDLDEILMNDKLD